MTRKFLIATHGALAQGALSSLQLIIGATEHVYTLQAYLDGNRSIETQLDEIIGQPQNGNPPTDDTEWVIFSDLLGGSITNQVLRQLKGAHIHVVAGFNLPLLIEVVLADAQIPVTETIENAIQRAREQMVYVNPLITSSNNSY